MTRNEPDVGAAAEDRDLMAQVQGGDERAFGLLMQRWERPVKALIGRLILNASEAEELAEETFVRVWQNREKFRVGAAFRPWLFTIAVNLTRNRLAWWRRRPAVALEDWNEVGELGAGSGETVGGAALLEQHERAAAVRAAIAELPRDLREALILFEYEQLSHAEIAEAVGTTSKAVETRIYRAKEKLRIRLQPWIEVTRL